MSVCAKVFARFVKFQKIESVARIANKKSLGRKEFEFEVSESDMEDFVLV